MAPAPLALTTEETNEVKHAVDFFAALGQYDRAVDALHHHVTQHGQSSALGWLELLNLLVVLGRRDEFVRASSEFTRLFNADLPPFERWGDAGPTLEDYRPVTERIVALWPSREAVKVLEDAIFKQPGRIPEVTFSMAAFAELVLLHQVCSELVARGEAGAAEGRRSFMFDPGWRPSVWSSMSPAAVAAFAATTTPSEELARKGGPAAGARPDLDLGQSGWVESIISGRLDVDLTEVGTMDAWGGPEPL